VSFIPCHFAARRTADHTPRWLTGTLCRRNPLASDSSSLARSAFASFNERRRQQARAGNVDLVGMHGGVNGSLYVGKDGFDNRVWYSESLVVRFTSFHPVYHADAFFYTALLRKVPFRIEHSLLTLWTSLLGALHGTNLLWLSGSLTLGLIACLKLPLV